MPRGRPKGFRESPETREKKRQKMLALHQERDPSHPTVQWAERSDWQAFGNRLDFLSVEARHLSTGKLSILPPKEPKRGKEAEETAEAKEA